VHTAARDKDAVSAATLAVEMALYHVSRGSTVIGRLRELYEKYGYFEETQVSKYFKGASGHTIMSGLMTGLRTKPPSSIGGNAVLQLKDFKEQTTLSLSAGTKIKDIGLPSSNVLQFLCDDHSIITARLRAPSRK